MALMNILSYRVDYSTHIEQELQRLHTCSDYDSFNEFDCDHFAWFYWHLEIGLQLFDCLLQF